MINYFQTVTAGQPLSITETILYPNTAFVNLPIPLISFISLILKQLFSYDIHSGLEALLTGPAPEWRLATLHSS